MRSRYLGTRRDRATSYLVLTIAAFAVTVAGVRWYLDLAGYPTVGGGELHIAHALWGGLALFIAALLPLLYSGQRTLQISALLAGLGAGLFIDEIGKFMTTSNDYFYAPAAPIIYGSILLLVLLWVLVRRRGVDGYDASGAVIEALADGLDGNLTAQDRRRVIDQMLAAQVRTAEPSAEADRLAEMLLAALESPAMDARLTAEGWIARGEGHRLLERLLPTRLERWLVVLSLIWAFLGAVAAALLLLASTQLDLEEALLVARDAGRMELPTEPVWILLVLGINVVVGLGAGAALVALWRGKTQPGLNLAVAAVLTNLVAGGLVTFYAAQVTALGSTIITVLQLGLIIDLRTRTLAELDDEAG